MYALWWKYEALNPQQASLSLSALVCVCVSPMVKVNSMAPIAWAPLKLLTFLFQILFLRCFPAHPLTVLRLLTLRGIFENTFPGHLLERWCSVSTFWSDPAVLFFVALVGTWHHIWILLFLSLLHRTWAQWQQGLISSCASNNLNRLQVLGVEWMSNPRLVPCGVYSTISEVVAKDKV